MNCNPGRLPGRSACNWKRGLSSCTALEDKQGWTYKTPYTCSLTSNTQRVEPLSLLSVRFIPGAKLRYKTFERTSNVYRRAKSQDLQCNSSTATPTSANRETCRAKDVTQGRSHRNGVPLRNASILQSCWPWFVYSIH